MRKLSLLLVVAIALTACNQKATVDTAKEQQALIDADAGFCAMQQKDGLSKAQEKYYTDDVVGISPNQMVEVGKAAILKQAADSKMDMMNTLNWKAEKAEVSSAGDLGYVWGHYTFKGKTKEGADSTWYGAYATIYRKTADGWKAVLDINNDTPKP